MTLESLLLLFRLMGKRSLLSIKDGAIIGYVTKTTFYKENTVVIGCFNTGSAHVFDNQSGEYLHSLATSSGRRHSDDIGLILAKKDADFVLSYVLPHIDVTALQ